MRLTGRFMGKVPGAVLVLGLVCGTILSAASGDAPPKELVQYIVDARRAGLKDPTIVQNAATAGWTSAMVENAIAYLKSQPAAPVQPGGSAPPANTTGGSGPASNSPAPSANNPAPNPPPPATSPAPAASEPTSEAPVIAKNRGVPDDYQIGAGDVLHINVWKEPDASVP